jgi:hypothetical protein
VRPERLSDRSRWLPRVVVLVGAFLALGPVLLHRGYVLVGDMTFVPRQPWKLGWLGLDGSPPRAVPADALVSVLSYAVPGDLIQKGVLLAVFLLGGCGVLRLLAGLTPAARVGAALLYMWNPYVYERLAIGHWGLLLGLAALPWVADAARRVREEAPRSLASLWVWLAVAAFSSPTGGLVAALVALTLATSRGAPRRNAGVCATALLVNLPWIVPGVLGHPGTSDPTGAEAFAARTDTPLGTVASLAGLGGIWKSSVAPGERSSAILAGAALVLTVVAVVCLWRVRSRSTHPLARLQPRRLVVAGLLALVLAWLPSTAVGADLIGQLIDHLPGAGLLRDSQKWLMPLVLVVALGFGVALDRVRVRVLDQALGWVVVALVGLPLLLLPGLAWGQLGQLRPVDYPTEWGQVAAQLRAAGAEDERIAVLPWSAYVRYPWNGHRAALDPAIRFFPGEVVTNGDLVLGQGLIVRGEDSRARAIGDAVLAGKPLAPVLRGQGVRWVLVENGVPGTGPVVVPQGRVVHDGSELTLVDVGGEAAVSRSGAAVPVLCVDALVAAVTVGALLSLGRRKRSRVG